MRKIKVAVGISGGPPSPIRLRSGLRRGKCKLRVAVGVSGGVDSALAAAMLKEQGYEVTGVFLECFNEPGCRTDQDRKDALGIALKLKIPFKVLDFKREYKQKVLDIFYREYKAGRTPNPDILCNQEIKFGMFLKWSLQNQFDFVATGHYARLQKLSLQRLRAGQIHLFRSVDEKKDQTYFLAMLKEEQLKRVMFPIGYLKKSQVRSEAKKRGLAVWNKKDSTGICFINHELNFKDFLKRKIKEHEGEVVDKTGKIIGKHKGFEFYTIGQRYAKPWFVIHKDILRNRLIVGKKADLAKKEFEVEKWSRIRGIKSIKNTQGFEAIQPQGIDRGRRSLLCRIRHQGRLIGCKIVGKKVKLAKNEYGIAPGQVAVIYLPAQAGQGFECLGGGVIK